MPCFAQDCVHAKMDCASGCVAWSGAYHFTSLGVIEQDGYGNQQVWSGCGGKNKQQTYALEKTNNNAHAWLEKTNNRHMHWKKQKQCPWHSLGSFLAQGTQLVGSSQGQRPCALKNQLTCVHKAKDPVHSNQLALCTMTCTSLSLLVSQGCLVSPT
jgi:hypothetical protein